MDAARASAHHPLYNVSIPHARSSGSIGGMAVGYYLLLPAQGSTPRPEGFYGTGRRGAELLEGVLIDRTNTGGMYGNFAGRDASRGTAKQSFDLGVLYHHLSLARCSWR